MAKPRTTITHVPTETNKICQVHYYSQCNQPKGIDLKKFSYRTKNKCMDHMQRSTRTDLYFFCNTFYPAINKKSPLHHNLDHTLYNW